METKYLRKIQVKTRKIRNEIYQKKLNIMLIEETGTDHRTSLQMIH